MTYKSSEGNLNVIILVIIFLYGCGNDPKATPEKFQYITCELVRIVDCNNVVVTIDGVEEQIKLLHVSAPKKNEVGYEQARKYLERLLSKTGPNHVNDWLILDCKELRRDDSGKIMAYMISPKLMEINGRIEWTNINAEMIRRGHSRYCKKAGKSNRFHDLLEGAEDEARKKKIGLWK